MAGAKLNWGQAIDASYFISVYEQSTDENPMRGGPNIKRIENMLDSPSQIRFEGSRAEEARALWRKLREAYHGKESSVS